MDNADYWVTAAQVMPVVALAVVVEARSVASKWTPATSKLLRTIQSVSWAAILVTLAFGEGVALNAMSGSKVAEGWITVTTHAVAGGMGILVLSPALELAVKGHAETIAWLLTLKPVMRLNLRRNDRAIRRYIRKIAEQHVERRQLLDERDRLLDSLNDRIVAAETELAPVEDLGDSVSKKQAEARDALRDFIDKYRSLLVQEREKAQVSREAFESDRADYERRRDEYFAESVKRDQSLGEATRQQRQALTALLLNYEEGESAKDRDEVPSEISDDLSGAAP